MNERTIWDMVLERLKTEHEYSSRVLALWFTGMMLEKLTPDTAYFSTDNDLKKSILETRYIDALRSDLAEVLGFEVQVVIYSTEKRSFASQFAGEDEEAVMMPESEKDDTVRNAAGKKIIYSPNIPAYSPEYTFDNFVVGNSNTMAYTMARSVAERPAVVANPLFLYGAPGLGKTHLLYAVTQEISRTHPDYTIIYVKGEDFTNELIEALANKTPILFREKYRKADVLLVDDIQFIAGKESIQEEFFHTYETLFEAGKQIIVTADRLPKDIKSLAERLRSRFEHGIIADVQPPDLELRVAIFKKKAQMLEISVSNDVLMYLGENIKDNIRQIEGALKKMRAYSIIHNTPITMEYAKNAVSDIMMAKATAITAEKVINYVSQKLGVPYEDIVGKRRTEDVVKARQIAMYLLRSLTELTFAGVGKEFNRDHSTVISAINMVKDTMEADPVYAATVESMEKDIRAIGY